MKAYRERMVRLLAILLSFTLLFGQVSLPAAAENTAETVCWLICFHKVRDHSPDSLLSAIAQYSELISEPMNLRPRDLAALATVPEPMNGS